MTDRVLIVDDDKNNLKAVNRILRASDCKVEFAHDGDEALRIVSTFKPDVAVLDVMMPGMNGYEVCRRLKSDDTTSNVMILLLSGKGALEDRLKGYGVQADDYLTKPFDGEELLAKIRILLRLKRAQDELRTLNQDLEKLVDVKTRKLVKKERQAIVGQMVQGIVHNLRGPTMVVHARAELASMAIKQLRDVLADDVENAREMVQRTLRHLEGLKQAVRKTEELISSLLSKGAQEAEEKKQWLDLNDIVVQEIEFLDADMDLKHGIKKNLDFDPSLPGFFGIYCDFSQIIYNLTKNASDAMRNSPRKELTISTEHDEQSIYIRFQDTGPGISPDHLERVFEPFFTTKPQEGSDNGDRSTGTGLGLHTCAQLMKSYGGDISVESKPGSGTTFTLWIPR